MGAASGHHHPVMADTPFIAIIEAEQARGGEEEPAPAPHPQMGAGAIDRQQDLLDPVAVGIEIHQPLLRRALIMRAAPAPFLLDREQIAILADQAMARHYPAGEEML